MKKDFMAKLIDEFKEFVLSGMDDGHHENFDDHLLFLESAFEVFIEVKNDEE